MLCRWKEKRGLLGATYKVLYEVLCHKYVDRKDLAGQFCILGSSDESKKKKDSTSELLREDSSRTKIYEWVQGWILNFLPTYACKSINLTLKN